MAPPEVLGILEILNECLSDGHGHWANCELLPLDVPPTAPLPQRISRPTNSSDR